MKPCSDFSHDIEHAVRVGRATYICPKCKRDISLLVMLYAEAKYGITKEGKQDELRKESGRPVL
jgi:hypothetical protein